MNFHRRAALRLLPVVAPIAALTIVAAPAEARPACTAAGDPNTELQSLAGSDCWEVEDLYLPADRSYRLHVIARSWSPTGLKRMSLRTRLLKPDPSVSSTAPDGRRMAYFRNVPIRPRLGVSSSLRYERLAVIDNGGRVVRGGNRASSAWSSTRVDRVRLSHFTGRLVVTGELPRYCGSCSRRPGPELVDQNAWPTRPLRAATVTSAKRRGYDRFRFVIKSSALTKRATYFRLRSELSLPGTGATDLSLIVRTGERGRLSAQVVRPQTTNATLRVNALGTGRPDRPRSVVLYREARSPEASSTMDPLKLAVRRSGDDLYVHWFRRPLAPGESVIESVVAYYGDGPQVIHRRVIRG